MPRFSPVDTVTLDIFKKECALSWACAGHGPGRKLPVIALVYAPEKDWLFLTFFTVNVTPHAYHAGVSNRMISL